jgi:hypothetical protein
MFFAQIQRAVAATLCRRTPNAPRSFCGFTVHNTIDK